MVLLLQFCYDSQLIFSCKAPIEGEQNSDKMKLALHGKTFWVSPSCVQQLNGENVTVCQLTNLQLGFLGARPDLSEIEKSVRGNGWEIVFWCSSDVEKEIVSCMQKDLNTDMVIESGNSHLIKHIGREPAVALIIALSLFTGCIGAVSHGDLTGMLQSVLLGAGLGGALVLMKTWAVSRFVKRFNCYALNGDKLFTVRN